MVLFTIKNSIGGEVFVPKIPSYRISDLAKAICPSCKIINIGIRPGEKIHEEMITVSDSFSTIDIGKYFLILPSNEKEFVNYYEKKFKVKRVPRGFSYNSGKNEEFLSKKEIRELLVKHVSIKK